MSKNLTTFWLNENGDNEINNYDLKSESYIRNEEACKKLILQMQHVLKEDGSEACKAYYEAHRVEIDTLISKFKSSLLGEDSSDSEDL